MSEGRASAISDDDLERISRRTSLDEGTLELAEQRWLATKKAILAGAEEEGLGDPNEVAREIRARFVSLRRLTDEARRITLLESEPEEVRTVYAIDPHLILGYSEYWRQKFQHFDFTRREWEPGQSKEREEFIVFLLSAILSMRETICLDAGRKEIADILAYLLDERFVNDKAAEQLEKFEDALDTILDQTGMPDRAGSRTSREQVSREIWKKFEALIGAGGIPYMRQSMATARLSSVLRSGRLLSSFAALRSKMRDEGGDQLAALSRAEALFNAFQRNDERFREARSSLYHAYAGFAAATDLGGQVQASAEPTMLRAGETSNINALFEMHLLNVCLSEAGARVRVHYVTDSPLLYDFVYGFPRNSFSVELVHPRHVFVFENKPTPENLARYRQVLVGPNAFVRAVPKDGKVKLSELDRFEKEFVGVLRDVRATYSFARVDSREGREYLAQVIVDFARRFGNDDTKQKLSIVSDILKSLTDKLEQASGKVDRLLGASADERSSIGFEAYRKFVEEMPLRGRANTLLVRTFGHAGRGTPRAVCIPLTGGFRNLFKIYDPRVVDEVSVDAGDSVSRMPTSGLLSVVEEASGHDSALRDFGRSIYAMADREWLLAISFTDATLRHLEFVPILADGSALPRVPGRSAEGRRRFLAQETLLVRHFARRGIAANLETLTRRQNRLLMAADDLRQSACVTQSIDDCDSFEVACEPNSLRHALAAIALAIEWLVLREMRRATGRAVTPFTREGRMLPDALDANSAWAGLAIERGTLQQYWNDELPVGSLRDDLAKLIGRIDGIAQEVQAGRAGDHSPEFWRYIQIRALSLDALVTVLLELSILPGERVRDPGATAATLRALMSSHVSFVRLDDGNGALDTAARLHPFTNFLADALNFMENERNATADIGSKIRRSQALLAISEDHYRLSENGFPRLISQTFLSRYGPEAAEKLKRLADTLLRDCMIGSTPFRPRLDD